MHAPQNIKSTYLFTYLLTPCSRVLLEKLTVFHLVKKFPTFYGTRKLITAFTSARHLSLSWAWSIQSMPPNPTYWRSILILYQMLRWWYRRWDGRALWHAWDESEMYVLARWGCLKAKRSLGTRGRIREEATEQDGADCNSSELTYGKMADTCEHGSIYIMFRLDE